MGCASRPGHVGLPSSELHPRDGAIYAALLLYHDLWSSWEPGPARDELTCQVWRFGKVSIAHYLGRQPVEAVLHGEVAQENDSQDDGQVDEEADIADGAAEHVAEPASPLPA